MMRIRMTALQTSGVAALDMMTIRRTGRVI